MPVSREGFTIDWVARIARKSVLNPTLITPIVLALFAAERNGHLAAHVSRAALSKSKKAGLVSLLLGTVLCVNNYLNRQSQNNWAAPSRWDWKNEIVVLTGGSNGFGARMAQMLLERNAETTIVILDFAPLGWTPPAGSRVHYIQADLSRIQVIKDVCERVRREIGDPTVLINNAGLCRGYAVMDASYDDIEKTVQTNLLAPLLLSKEFLPHMARHNHGHIVNVSSISALVPVPTMADYSATKAGVKAMHEAIQLEVRKVAPKVRHTLLMPSFARTGLFKGSANHANFLSPTLHPDTVAEAVVDALYSQYGQTILLPWLMPLVTALTASGPTWLSRRIRAGVDMAALDFTGRQKIDPVTGGLVKA